MAYVITCDDGVKISGETLDDCLDKAEVHLREAHPELLGTVGREQLATMATEV